MGWFTDFKQTLDESPGRILWGQLGDTAKKLRHLPEPVATAAYLGFLHKRALLRARLANMSPDGRIATGITLQKRARDTFDLDLAEGYALWLTGAWLETMDRPGPDATRTHQALDGMPDLPNMPRSTGA